MYGVYEYNKQIATHIKNSEFSQVYNSYIIISLSAYELRKVVEIILCVSLGEMCRHVIPCRVNLSGYVSKVICILIRIVMWLSCINMTITLRLQYCTGLQ